MFCGIVEFPLKIAFDLETTPYIYFELPGDLSARGPAASICAPHISHIRNRCDVGLRRYKDILQMHGVNSSHQDGKSSASCMLGAQNRSDLPKLPFGRCFQIEPRWELTWLKVSNYGIT